MNAELKKKIAVALAEKEGKQFAGLEQAEQTAYLERADSALTIVFHEAVMPEYERWRNMCDNEGIAIGAIGAVSNIAAKMMVEKVEE